MSETATASGDSAPSAGGALRFSGRVFSAAAGIGLVHLAGLGTLSWSSTTCHAGDSGFGCLFIDVWILLGWILVAVIGGRLLLRWARVPRPGQCAALALALLVVIVVAVALLTIHYTFAVVQRRFEALDLGVAPWAAMLGVGGATATLAGVGLLNGHARRVLAAVTALIVGLLAALSIANLVLR